MPTTATSFYPFDAGAGSAIAESQWRGMARHWLPSGPLITDLAPSAWGVLKPTAGAGLQVLVAAGSAWIRGHYAEWSSQSTLTIAANASGSTRVDAIVARVDFVGNDVELDVVQGTPGAGLPALTQNTSVWEILLGSSTLTSGGSSVTVTDSRQCVGYSDTTYTPTVRFGSTVATTSSMTARVIRRDGLVHVRMFFTLSNLNGGTGSLNVSLPVDQRVLVATPSNGSVVGGVFASSTIATAKQALAVAYDTDADSVYATALSEAGGGSGAYLWDHADVPASWSLRFDFDYEAAN